MDVWLCCRVRVRHDAFVWIVEVVGCTLVVRRTVTDVRQRQAEFGKEVTARLATAKIIFFPSSLSFFPSILSPSRVSHRDIKIISKERNSKKDPEILSRENNIMPSNSIETDSTLPNTDPGDIQAIIHRTALFSKSLHTTAK